MATKICLVEASIADLQHALSTGSITSVELVSKYLTRIAAFDARGPCLNSIPILNPGVFEEAAASDARRAAGKAHGPLDGIPYTLKDSMKYKGMACANGSQALEHVIANEDSFVAEQLRDAGAVNIGRTNMPPMAASGMHRGVHGRAESPYNLQYLTAAFSSGSSNGSGTSTAASFAAFGLGSETVSSGRSPASNNALIAYTPSRTVISPRGVWPLYPTCDVIVPHTRSVEDMLAILDVLTMVDRTKEGDFWREQEFVEIPFVERPQSYVGLKTDAVGSLKGKAVAIPRMYIGGHDTKAKPTTVSQDVIDLWTRARTDLESLGAKVVETDFPLVTNYEDDSLTGETNNVVGFPPDWNSKERGELVSYLWDDFLLQNADPTHPNLASISGPKIFPRPSDYLPDRYMEHKNFMNYPSLVETARHRPNNKPIWQIDGIATALPALEAQRHRDLESWLTTHKLDFVVFPANGDVGKSDLETNPESAHHALQNGVKYSHGNRALRHMGVPTVSVPMGVMRDTQMPVNLTFAGPHGCDAELLRYACDFEQRTKRRVAPPVTPALPTDDIEILPAERTSVWRESPMAMEILSAERVSETDIAVRGRILQGAEPSPTPIELAVSIDGVALPASAITITGSEWSFRAAYQKFQPPKPFYGGVGQVVNNAVVIITAGAQSQNHTAGKLILIDQNSAIKG